MRAYRPRAPRVALSIAAAALATAVFGASIMLPATHDSVDTGSCIGAEASGAKEPIAVDIHPGRIDVIAIVVRDPQARDPGTTADAREIHTKRQRPNSHS